MLTTFQRDTYPFLIRCLFVCFSVIVRFSSSNGHYYCIGTNLRSEPSSSRLSGNREPPPPSRPNRHTSWRLPSATLRWKGNRETDRLSPNHVRRTGIRRKVHQHVNSQCRLSRTGGSHCQHREIPTPNAVELPFFADFLQRALESRLVYPITRQHAVDTGQGRMLVGYILSTYRGCLVGGIDAVGNGRGAIFESTSFHFFVLFSDRPSRSAHSNAVRKP